jgi:glycosyltransferase involved in cell wall biosynthesis
MKLDFRNALQVLLAQRFWQAGSMPDYSIEILVSDNCSTDDTPQVVQRYASTVPPFRSLRNLDNIESDANIAQCLSLARGKYVLLLGEDDILIENNSGGYDFSRVFVEEFGRILDDSRRLGLSENGIRKIETRMLLSYYPYLLRQRRDRSGDLAATTARFDVRFGRRGLCLIWLAPILRLPRPLAVAWGTLATLFGRAVTGEPRRGLAFAIHRMNRE